MKIFVNMVTPGLDVCPECKNLIVKVEGAWLDVWTSGPYYADDTKLHKHQPALTESEHDELFNGPELRAAAQFERDTRPASSRERLDSLQAGLISLHGDSDLPAS